MKLFEAIWRQGYDYFERVNISGKTTVNKINTKNEYFIEDTMGTYKYILDKNKLLSKKSGKPPEDIKVYGVNSPDAVHIRDYYWDEVSPKYNLSPTIWYLDIETTAFGKINIKDTPEEVVLIQIYNTTTKTCYVLGSRGWSAEESYKSEYAEKYPGIEFKYLNCKNEQTLLDTFFKLISVLTPLLTLGWNTEGFDYPYLFNRSKLLGFDTNRFSPFSNTGGKADLKITTLLNGQITYKLIADGCFYMDYMEIYKKYTYKPQVSYSLDNIANVELGKGKVNHSFYSTFDGFRTGMSYIFPETEPDDDYDKKMWNLQVNYRDSKSPDVKLQINDLANDLFVHYGIIDTIILKELDDKLQLSKILLMISSKMGVQLSDTLGTVKPWAAYISNKSFKDRLILPADKVDEDADVSIKGGFVADPQKGKHKWCISVDINSAYPNLSMRGFNMSPETFVFPNKIPEDLLQMKLKYFNDEDEESRFKMYLEQREIFDEYSALLCKYNMSGSVSGALYTKDFQGIIPTLVGELYQERKKIKSQMLKWEQEKIKLKESGEDYKHAEYMENQCNTEQMVVKVLINSLNV